MHLSKIAVKLLEIAMRLSKIVVKFAKIAFGLCLNIIGKDCN